MILSEQVQWAAHTELAEVESVSFLFAGLQLHCNSPGIGKNRPVTRNEDIRKSQSESDFLSSNHYFEGGERDGRVEQILPEDLLQ